MWTEIQDTLTGILPSKKKTASSGWISFNAPCCVHHGETPDTRGRGGVIFNGQGTVNYHCFNCSYKANYTPGRLLNYKFKKLLSWFGADDAVVNRLVIEAMRIKDLVGPDDIVEAPKEEVQINARSLPKDLINLTDARPLFNELPVELQRAINYMDDRKVNLEKYPAYWTSDKANNMHRRVIVPVIWRKKIMGYTARAVDSNVKPKYHNNYEYKLVFNLDMQEHDNEIAIVCEGPFDALAIDGVATLGNTINDIQADLIDNLDKHIIVVADADEAGAGLIKVALKHGWSVSFPVWQSDYKDISEAVQQLGKLFVLKTIIDGVETNPLKIKLRRKINV
jgi:hypothetical protein